MKKHKKKEIIIFCGAPADIQYTLHLYEKNVNKADISIFCINVQGMYQFLSSLNLILKQLVFIPYTYGVSIKNPIKVVRERIRLKSLYNRYFFGVKAADIYFFSCLYDWVVYSFLERLIEKNKLLYIDVYNYLSLNNSFMIKRSWILIKLNLVMLKYISKADIKWFFIEGRREALKFNIDKKNITIIDRPLLNNELYSKYSYSIESNTENNLLLFECNESDIINYKRKITDIVIDLKNNGFLIYLKPHPRISNTSSLEKIVDYIIPEYIPGEFINPAIFTVILGVSTVALAKFAKNGFLNCYSLLKLFEYKNEKTGEQMRKYLIDQSDGKINFIDDLVKLKLK